MSSKINCWEFMRCRRLKDDPKTRSIPIIIVSASGGKDLPGRCLAAGADDVVIKPFEPHPPRNNKKIALE